MTKSNYSLGSIDNSSSESRRRIMNCQKPLVFSKKLKLPLILQDEQAECGHACVAMISNYWGHKLDLYEMRHLHNTSNRGVTLLDLNLLLERLGFITRPIQVQIDELHLVKCPAILHWNMNHFVVLKEVKKNYVIIHDPAVGVRHCPIAEVSQSFTGIVLEAFKSSDFKEIRSSNKLTLYELVKSIKGVNIYVILLILLSLALEVISLLNPLFMQYVTDNVIGYSERSNLYLLASCFFLLGIFQVFIEYIRGNMVIYFTTNLTEQFSSNVVNHILKLPMQFFERRHKGDLQAKFQSIDVIQKKISTDFVNTVLDGFIIFINLAVMMIYSPILTFVVILALLLCLSFRYITFKNLRQQTQTSINQHAKSMTLFLETLQGILPIKSFLKERVRFNTWRNSYIESLNADIKVARLNVNYEVFNQLLFHVEHILVVCIGATLVLSNRLSVGMLIAFLAYRLLLVNKTSSFIQNIFNYKLIAVQLDRLSDILFQQPEFIKSGSGDKLNFNGSLRLENVCFRYNQNENYILNNINLSINAGEKIAIIGGSGSGKSTLLKIMMGLLSVIEGEIFIDNMPLKDFGLKNYREFTSAVMQDDALLSGSIIDNISFFAEEINLEEVYKVAKLSFIHDEIMKFPMGYETLVGDMGSTLSGGQKQRILLARALYKQPKILFLDEATSHLDITNEKNINNSLKSLNITQIVIAHRQETILMADRIIDIVGSVY